MRMFYIKKSIHAIILHMHIKHLSEIYCLRMCVKKSVYFAKFFPSRIDNEAICVIFFFFFYNPCNNVMTKLSKIININIEQYYQVRTIYYCMYISNSLNHIIMLTIKIHLTLIYRANSISAYINYHVMSFSFNHSNCHFSDNLREIC